MEALLTIVIWLGSGFAFAVGVIFGATLFRRRKYMVRQEELQEESVSLLRERNKIGLEHIHQLAEIARAIGRHNNSDPEV